jgi:hypothetical protein
MNKIIILILVMCLLGCSKVVDVQLEPEVQMFLRSDLQQRFTLTQKDPAYVELNKWLDENRGNWQATSGRYPGGVYVKSGNYGIQVTELKVILYSTLGDEPVAIYIQQISKDELRSVFNFGK